MLIIEIPLLLMSQAKHRPNIFQMFPQANIHKLLFMIVPNFLTQNQKNWPVFTNQKEKKHRKITTHPLGKQAITVCPTISLAFRQRAISGSSLSRTKQFLSFISDRSVFPLIKYTLAMYGTFHIPLKVKRRHSKISQIENI